MLDAQITTLPVTFSDSEIDNAFRLFQQESGKEIVQAVQAVLGTDEIGLTLSEAYAKEKPTRPGYQRVAGKPEDQPLILTANLYQGVEATPLDNGVQVAINPGHGVAQDGFDYAEYWQSGEGSTHGFHGLDYLGKGFDKVEDNFEERLLDVAFAALGLEVDI